jgi:hypothetical protein
MRNPLFGFAAPLVLTAAIGLGADAPLASTPESEGISGQRLQSLHESLDR